MPENRENIDDFWDISSLVPKRRTVSHAPASDTSPATLRISNSKIEMGEKIPERKAEAEKCVGDKTVYFPESPFIEKVELIPWSNFSFYSKFHADAVKYFNIPGKECDYEYFFSYMPQYEQLSHRQMRFYLFWRSRVQNGEYPEVDSSYIFLYVYEILNLHDVLSPEERASALCEVWLAYREKYKYLDKYLGEWLCDLCLIHQIPPPEKALGVLCRAAPKLSFPEFFFSEEASILGAVEPLLKFNYKQSRFFKEHEKEWSLHIPAATSRAISPLLERGGASEQSFHTVRDSFSGAIACSGIKYKILLTYKSPRKSKAFLKAVELCEKTAENELRAQFDIKSRYSVSELPEECKKIIKTYFDAVYPLRRAKKKSEDDASSEAYMKFYAPRQVGKADVARALRIERDAWETAILLEPESVASGSAAVAAEEAADLVGGAQGARASADAEAARRSDVPFEHGGEMYDFISSLDGILLKVLRAAFEGSLAEFCRGNGIMPLDAVRRINELSSEYIGDIVIGDDMKIIEDYKDDILSEINGIRP